MDKYFVLFEAWGLWAKGEMISDLNLWGLPILWWGRIGKGALFLAGATIVLEILGPEKMRSMAARHWKVNEDLLKSPTDWVRQVLGLVFISLISTGVGMLVWKYDVAPIPISLFVGFFNLLLWSLFIQDVVAKIFETERPGNAFRLAAIWLALIGFHFDLLAS